MRVVDCVYDNQQVATWVGQRTARKEPFQWFEYQERYTLFSWSGATSLQYQILYIKYHACLTNRTLMFLLHAHEYEKAGYNIKCSDRSDNKPCYKPSSTFNYLYLAVKPCTLFLTACYNSDHSVRAIYSVQQSEGFGISICIYRSLPRPIPLGRSGSRYRELHVLGR